MESNNQAYINGIIISNFNDVSFNNWFVFFRKIDWNKWCATLVRKLYAYVPIIPPSDLINTVNLSIYNGICNARAAHHIDYGADSISGNHKIRL